MFCRFGLFSEKPNHPESLILDKKRFTMANKVATFFKDIKLEMQKVAWPTKQELISSTAIVLISLAILSAFVGVCDIVLSTAVNVIMSRL
jgi:preprotein translocase subunit SecE